MFSLDLVIHVIEGVDLEQRMGGHRRKGFSSMMTITIVSMTGRETA